MPKNANVDERIVEMRIDNKNFESGAKKTISTLEKLDKALKIKGGTNALDDLEKSINKFDTSNMTKGLEKVQMSFSALEIAGMRVISNLTDSIMGFTTKMAKALTIDQVSAGWNKYEKMIESTQTIMAATQNMIGKDTLDDGTAAILDKTMGVYRDAQGALTGFVDQASQMQVVQDYLDGLLWFADETSYSFNDMTDNMGKFLAAGVDIESAYKSMMGVASWGATAGAKPAEVSRALYNISQAMGSGAMKNIDWRSIENANMATLGFKQTAIEIAESMGKLQHVTSELTGKDGFVGLGVEVNDAGHIIKKTDEEVEDMFISAENFRESLQSGWFDKEVMQEVFSRYGQFAEQLRESTEATDVEATGLLEVLDKYRKAEDAEKFWANYAKSANLSVDELKSLREEISKLDAIGVEYDFSEQGFRRGQEAKTFTDAIEATKDAVSSRWMESFKYIFGDYLQAKEFWTQVTGELYNMFAAGGDVRNEVLEAWAEVDEFQRSGRDYLLGIEYDDEGEVQFKGALWNLVDAVHSVTDPINEAFAEAFGLSDTSSAGHMLRELTKRFQEFTAELGFSESAQNGIKSAFKGFFTILRNGLGVFGKVVQVASRFAMVIGNVFDGIISLGGALGDLIRGDISFDEFAEQIQGFYKSVKDNFKETLKSLIPTEEQILNLYNRISSKYNEVVTMFQEGFTWDNFKKLLPSFGSLNSAIDRIWDSFKTNYPQIAAKLDEWRNGSFLGQIVNSLLNGASKISEFFSNIKIDTKAASGVFEKFAKVVSFIFSGLFGNTEDMQARIEQFVLSIWNGFQKAISGITFGDVLKAIRTAGFTVLLAEVGQILVGFKQMQKEFTGIPQALSGLLGDAGTMLKDIGKGFKANAYIKMAAAIGILALSLWGLSKIPEDKLTHVIVTLSILIGVLSIFAKRLGGITKIIGDRGDTTKITVFSNLASALIGFGLVIGAVAALVLVAKNVKLGQLIAIFVGLGVILAEMAFITKKMADVKFENAKGVIGTILAFSLAINMLIPVMAVLVACSWNAWARAIFGVVGLFAALGTLMFAMSKLNIDGSNMLKVAGSMAIFALALDMMIPIIAVLAAMSGSAFGKSFASLLGLLVVLGAALAGLSLVTSKLNIDGKKLMQIAGAFAILSLAISLLVPAIAGLALVMTIITVTIPWEKLGDRMDAFGKALWKLLGFAGVMTVFGLAAVLIGAGVLAMGAGFFLAGAGAVLLAIGLNGIALAIVAVGKAMPKFVEGLAKTGELITAQNAANIIKGAVAFGVLAAAILVLAKNLGKLFSLGNVKSNLSSFGSKITAGISSIFQTISGKLGAALPQILQVLGSLLVVIGLYLVGVIPTLANTAGRAIITLFESIHQIVRANKGALEHSIFGIVETFLEVLLDSGTWLFTIVRTFISEIAKNIFEWLAEQVEQIPGIGSRMANSLRDMANQLPAPDELMSQWTAQKGTNEAWLRQFIPPAEEFQAVTSESIDGAIAGITGKGAELNGAIDTLRADAAGAVSAIQPDVDAAATAAGESGAGNFISTFTNGLSREDITAALTSAGSSITGKTLEGANTFTSENASVGGQNFVTGVANGTYERIQDAYDAGYAVGEAEMQGYDDATSTASPSKEMIKRGIYAVQGLVKGLQQSETSVYSESASLGHGMLDVIQTAMSQIAMLAMDDLDISPVITPVVDLTNINAATGSINGAFSGAHVGISGEITGSVARRLDQAERVASNMEARSQTINNTGDNFTFNIYASEGMDENAIADAVMNRMQTRMVRRGAAFG